MLADVIVIMHLCYIFYAVGGEFVIISGGLLKWRWTSNIVFRITHLALVIFVALEASAGMLCPLTVWEYNLRKLAGQQSEQDIAFMARLVRTIIFYDLPAWFFTTIYILFGLLVILTYILFPPGFKKKEIASGAG